MPQVLVSAKFPADLVEALRACAKESERTLSAELRHAARKHLSTTEGAPAQGALVKASDHGARHATA